MAAADKPRHHKASLVVAPGALVVSIDADQMKKMIDKCVRETGKVTFGLREVSVTKLGEISEAFVIVN